MGTGAGFAILKTQLARQTPTFEAGRPRRARFNFRQRRLGAAALPEQARSSLRIRSANEAGRYLQLRSRAPGTFSPALAP